MRLGLRVLLVRRRDRSGSRSRCWSILCLMRSLVWWWSRAAKGQVRLVAGRGRLGNWGRRSLLVWTRLVVRSRFVSRRTALSGIVDTSVDAGIAHRARALHYGVLSISVRSLEAVVSVALTVIVIFIIILRRLGITASHAHIPSNPDAAALLGNYATEAGALGQTWELLRAVHHEWLRLDLEAEVNVRIGDHRSSVHQLAMRVHSVSEWLDIHILGLLQFLEQVEAQPVLALVAHGEIREDEVASLRGTIQVCHARNGHASQHRQRRLRRASSHGSNLTGRLQGCEQEEIGIVLERNVRLLLAFKHLQFDNGWRVDRSSVRRCCAMSVSCDARRGKPATYTLPQNHKLLHAAAAAEPATRR